MAIFENGRRTPQYQQNGARRNQALGLRIPSGQTPTSPRDVYQPDPRRAAQFARNLGVAGVGDPAIPPPTNYDDLFRKSIDTQRGAIDTQLRSAMSALAAREASANGLLARRPGEINANYDAAEPSIQQAAKDSAATQAALNITPLAGDQAGLAPIQAGLAQARAGALSDQPYLQAGTQDLYQRQRGALDTSAMEARSALEAQQQDYYMQQAQAQQAQKQQEDSFYQHAQFTHDLQKQDLADEARAKSAEERKQLDASEPSKETQPKLWWSWYMRRHPQQAHSFLARQGGAMGNAQRLLTKGEYRNSGTGGLGIAWSALSGGNAVSQASQGKSPFSDSGAGGGRVRRQKLGLDEVLQRFKGPKYARLRAALIAQYR